jgi:subtilisin family serine protease
MSAQYGRRLRILLNVLHDPLMSSRFIRPMRVYSERVAGPAIALVDTGVDVGAVSFATPLPGVNFSGEGRGDCTKDENGHGTAMAATILQHAPHARIVAVKLMGRYGYPRIDGAIEQAFAWLIRHRAALGIRVICAAVADGSELMTDGQYRRTVLCRYVAALRSRGVATVMPAGNRFEPDRGSNAQGMAWPAILREVVSVGALVREAGSLRLSADTRSLHRDCGSACHTTMFAEPGEPGGTSGAAAVVAGCMGRLAAAYPEWTVDRIVEEASRGRTTPDEEGRSWPTLDTLA